MAGISLVMANLNTRKAFQTVSKVSRNLKYQVTPDGDGGLHVQKGSLWASIIIGAFEAYCDFHVTIQPEESDHIEIEIERNNPWWTGLIGISRVKSRATELADEIVEALEDEGGELLERATF